MSNFAATLPRIGTSGRFWLNLQSRYDLEVALETHVAELDQIHPLIPA